MVLWLVGYVSLGMVKGREGGKIGRRRVGGNDMVFFVLLETGRGISHFVNFSFAARLLD